MQRESGRASERRGSSGRYRSGRYASSDLRARDSRVCVGVGARRAGARGSSEDAAKMLNHESNADAGEPSRSASTISRSGFIPATVRRRHTKLEISPRLFHYAFNLDLELAHFALALVSKACAMSTPEPYVRFNFGGQP